MSWTITNIDMLSIVINYCRENRSMVTTVNISSSLAPSPFFWFWYQLTLPHSVLSHLLPWEVVLSTLYQHTVIPAAVLLSYPYSHWLDEQAYAALCSSFGQVSSVTASFYAPPVLINLHTIKFLLIASPLNGTRSSLQQQFIYWKILPLVFSVVKYAPDQLLNLLYPYKWQSSREVDMQGKLTSSSWGL